MLQIQKAHLSGIPVHHGIQRVFQGSPPASVILWLVLFLRLHLLLAPLQAAAVVALPVEAVAVAAVVDGKISVYESIVFLYLLFFWRFY